MTIKDAAELYGISTQAVYQRLKKESIDLKRLKDKSTGHLTPDAEVVFCKLFTRTELKKTGVLNSSESTDSTDKKLIETLQKELFEMVERLKVLENENSELKADKASWSRALEFAQRVQLEQLEMIKRLPAGQTQRKTIGETVKGWFVR